MKSLLQSTLIVIVCTLSLSTLGASRNLPMESAALSHYSPKVLAKAYKAEKKSHKMTQDYSVKKMQRRLHGSWFKRLFSRAY